MRVLLRRIVLLAATALIAAPAGLLASTMMLDTMTAPFPANACLPITQKPILFLGSYCDGAACPPDTWVGPNCPGAQRVMQLALPGVHAQVYGRITNVYGAGQAQVRIEPAEGLLYFDCSDSELRVLELQYSAGTPMDLVTMGAQSIHIPLQGNITPSRPMWCLAQLSANQLPGHPSAMLVIKATQSGDLVLPLADFIPAGVPFDFSQTTTFGFAFRDCGVPGAPTCAPNYPARPFTIGPLTFEIGMPTPLKSGSWGRLKAIYH